MKKIFAFIGSPLKDKSNTATLTRMLLDSLKKHVQFESEVLTAGDVRLGFCRGCWTCMTKGFCPQDRNDDLQMLKAKILEADFVIFGSPVYTMNVTGQAKTFLDRLCAWYHLLPLAGKAGMTVTTTASTGQPEIHQFLSMLMLHLGVKVVSSLDAIGYFPAMLADPASARTSAEAAAKEIAPYISGSRRVETDKKLEEAFQFIKAKVTYGREFLPADYEYWKEKGMLGLNSFAELLEKSYKGGPHD
jgi:multimeric flavodoxin WrbA